LRAVTMHGCVLIGAGTDAGISYVMHEEFAKKLLHMEAIQYATISNAKLVCLERLISSLEFLRPIAEGYVGN